MAKEKTLTAAQRLIAKQAQEMVDAGLTREAADLEIICQRSVALNNKLNGRQPIDEATKLEVADLISSIKILERNVANQKDHIKEPSFRLYKNILASCKPMTDNLTLMANTWREGLNQYINANPHTLPIDTEMVFRPHPDIDFAKVRGNLNALAGQLTDAELEKLIVKHAKCNGANSKVDGVTFTGRYETEL
ncbi:MAG: hypothetical protein K0U41_09370 [Gammaproteobacteria bacterium]|nr:hypothetical protein [Gammaproteobacteria bacterium]